MKRTFSLVSAVLAAAMVSSACGSDAADLGMDVEAPADPAVLMEADRAFSAAVAGGGSEAWASWFTEDGAIVREGDGEIRGRADVQAAMASLDAPGVRLTWDPIRADIAASGDLGWTTGGWVSEVTDAEGLVTTNQGVYVSIWRLQDDGTWKVAMDLGNPTEAASGG